LADDRIFALVAMGCLLLWLLARERSLRPGLRRRLQLVAFLGLAGGIAYALALTLAHYLG
jgi:hypothetical protein